MQVTPVTLEGHDLRLEPLGAGHREDLRAAATPDVYRYLTLYPRDDTREAFDEYFDGLLSMEDRISFAMVLRDSGRAVGTSSYLDIRPEHRGVEIGNTWIGRRYQGSRVNPEAKLLMLRHAFEELGALRVQLKCDARNLQSQRAIEKLGALREGVLRKHMILADGYVRDTVMYSITDKEWPGVRERLVVRLGYDPAPS